MADKPQKDEKPFIKMSVAGAIGVAIVIVLIIAYFVGVHNNPGSTDNVVTPGCHDFVSGNEC